MKLQDINNLIEETFFNEIKSRILQEQENTEAPVKSIDPNFSDVEKMSKFNSLESLAPFQGKITNIEKQNNGIIIHIEELTEDELKSCCGANTLDDAIRILNRNLTNDIIKSGIMYDDSKDALKHFDVDIDLGESGQNIEMTIKITSSEGFDNEISEDMKNIKQQPREECNERSVGEGRICECGRTLAPTEEMCECGKINPYFVTQEQAAPCEECGDEEMTEQKFDPASKDTGKGKYGTKENKLTDVFNESELSGVNNPNEYGHTDLKADSINESKPGKKVIRLSEEKFREMIKKIVTEATKVKVVGETQKVSAKTKPFKNATKSEMTEKIVTEPAGTVPGLQAVKTAHEGDSKEEKEYMNSVDKKMKDYLNFDDNDIKEPETGDFPKQIGEGDKVAHRNTSEEEEYIDTYRGMKPQDAVYDTPPSKQFVDRVKKALSGDSTMGNKQDKDTANISLSELGEKLFKDVKTKRDAMTNDPMYVKDKQPVEDIEKYDKETHDLRTVAEEETNQAVIEEEIKRMKAISTYGKKTQ